MILKAEISKLGIISNAIAGGCKNEDGSYTFTDYESLFSDKIARFSININGDSYEGTYKGIALINADKKTGSIKLSSSGLKELRENGRHVLSFEKPTGLYVSGKKGILNFILEDSTKTLKPLINKL
jgi:hypothetical protein